MLARAYSPAMSSDGPTTSTASSSAQRAKTSSEIDAGLSSVGPTSRIRIATPLSLSIRAASTSSTMPLSRSMRAAQTAIGGPSAGMPGL